MVLEKMQEAEASGQTVEAAARELVAEHLDDPALGISDLYLEDPAAKRMLARAKKLGVAGPYIAFLEAMAEAAKELSDTPGRRGPAGCDGRDHDGPGIHPGSDLGDHRGDAFVRGRRPLHRGSRARGIHSARRAPHPEGALRRTGGPTGATAWRTEHKHARSCEGSALPTSGLRRSRSGRSCAEAAPPSSRRSTTRARRPASSPSGRRSEPNPSNRK